MSIARKTLFNLKITPVRSRHKRAVAGHLRKYGELCEVAIAVEGLLSSFSDHMTGLNILHDGGFTRAY